MENLNYCCAGCFFAGTVNGYEPECCKCVKKDSIVSSRNKSKNKSYMLEHIDELLPDENQSYTTLQNNKKARRMQRRIDTKKYAKKAPNSLAIVNAKLDRLQASATKPTDFTAANKKCFNASKKAVYSYQTSITLAFPKIPKETSFGRYMDTLCFTISGWKAAKDVSLEMKIACKNACDILKEAIAANGQLVGLHRKDNVLQVKIGFRDKTSKLDFIRKTAAA